MNLILINGPSGAGKTTVSKLLVGKVPGAILIATDTLRESIPETKFVKNGKPDREGRSWHANILGQRIASRALEEGKSVIVDSIKYHTDWVQPWEELGRKYNARVVDICITAPVDVILKRADQRGYDSYGILYPEKVAELYDKVTAFYADRPSALIIDTENLSPDKVLNLILKRIG